MLTGPTSKVARASPPLQMTENPDDSIAQRTMAKQPNMLAEGQIDTGMIAKTLKLQSRTVASIFNSWDAATRMLT